MIDGNSEEICNDNSLEGKAKKQAKEYFKLHSLLKKDNLESFVDLVGLNVIWSTQEEKMTIWELFIKHGNKDDNDSVDEKAVMQGLVELFYSDNISHEPSLFSDNLQLDCDDFDNDLDDKDDCFNEETKNTDNGPLSPRSSMTKFFGMIDTETLKRLKCLNIILDMNEEHTLDTISESLEKYKFIALPYEQVVEYVKLISVDSLNDQDTNSDSKSTLDKEMFQFANEAINKLIPEINQSNWISFNKIDKDNNRNSNDSSEEANELIDSLMKMDYESYDYINAIRLLLDQINSSNKQNDIHFLLNQFTTLIKAKITKLSMSINKAIIIEMNKNSIYHTTLNKYIKTKSNVYSIIDLQENMERLVKSNLTLIDQLKEQRKKNKALNSKLLSQEIEMKSVQFQCNQLEELNKEIQKHNYYLKEDLNKANLKYSSIINSKSTPNNTIETQSIDSIKTFIQDLETKNREYNEVISKRNLEKANLQKELSNLTIQCHYLKEENKRLNNFDQCRANTYFHDQLFSNTKNHMKRDEESFESPSKCKSFISQQDKDTTDNCLNINNILENEYKPTRDIKDWINPNTSILSCTNKTERSIISSSTNRKRRLTKSQKAIKEDKESFKNHDLSSSRLDMCLLKESNGDRFLLETSSFNCDGFVDNDTLSNYTLGDKRWNNILDKDSLNDSKFLEQNDKHDNCSYEPDHLLPVENVSETASEKKQLSHQAVNHINNTIREDEEEDKSLSEHQSQFHFSNSNNYSLNQSKPMFNSTSINSSSHYKTIDSYFTIQERDNLLNGQVPLYDFINIRSNQTIVSFLKGHHDDIIPVELFSDTINYIQSNKKVRAFLILTSQYFYILREYDLSCRVRINRKYIGTITISSKQCNFISFHFHTGNDAVIEIFRRMELLYYLRDLYSIKKYGKCRIKYDGDSRSNQNQSLKSKHFPITPNYENAQKMGYLFKYNDNFFSYSLTEQYVVLCSIGLIYCDEPSKAPKKIIPIIGTKISSKVLYENGKYYCFSMKTIDDELVIFCSKSKEVIKSWMIEFEAFKHIYKVRMMGLDTQKKDKPLQEKA